MKIVFMLPVVGISGGINVVVQHAQFLAENGNEIYLAAWQHNEVAYDSFLLGRRRKFRLIDWNEAQKMSWDIAIATWWPTIFELDKVDALKTVLLLQAWEGQFYQYKMQAQNDFIRALSSPGLHFIVIANWLREALIDYAGIESTSISVSLNGISQHFFNVELKKDRDKVLIEGSLKDPRKNVLKSATILEQLSIPYSILTSSREVISRKYNPSEIYQAIEYSKVPEIYASHSVLFKLSSAEGMFGPPLEMFATGGTAVVWDVEGSEEYMRHTFNSLLAPVGNFRKAKEQMQILWNSSELLNELSENAKRTAGKWLTWKESSEKFQDILQNIPNKINTNKNYSSWVKHRDEIMSSGTTNSPFNQEKSKKFLPNVSLARLKRKVIGYPNLMRFLLPIWKKLQGRRHK